MKKLLSLILSVATISVSFGQMDSLKFDKLLLDFTIPDMPAFKALGTDPSDILRPSDIKKFAIMMSPFVANGKGIIPNSFALEVAPFKLLDAQSKNPLKISDYTNHTRKLKRFLYNTSFSLGTNQVENDKNEKFNNLAVGLRTSLVGKKSSIYRSAESKAIFDQLSKDQGIRADLENEWISQGKITLAELNDTTNAKTISFKAELNKLISSKAADAIVKKFNETNWNANRGEIAVAWVGQSPDSLIANIRSGSWNIWGVYANSLGSKKSQLLLGSTLKYFEQSTEISGGWDMTFNARLYHGTKNFRAFAEYQFKKQNSISADTGLLNIGSELRILKEFWIVFSGGVENLYATDSKSSFVSKFDIRYSFNNPNN